MRLRTISIVLSAFYVLVGCASAQIDTAENEELLASMLDQKSFKIISESATPQNTTAFNAVANAGLLAPGNTPGFINLNGNANYIRVHGDSISGSLPFFGERRMGGAYGDRGAGIEFEDVVSDFKIKQGKKKIQEISFSIRDKQDDSERYRVLIYMYPSLRTSVNINSTHRTIMMYRGTVSELKNDN